MILYPQWGCSRIVDCLDHRASADPYEGIVKATPENATETQG